LRHHGDFCTVTTAVHSKATSIWRPLASSSNHPKGIHMTWPISYLQRIVNRSQCLFDAKRFCREFLRRFMQASPMHIAIPGMQLYIRDICLTKPTRKTREESPLLVSWLVLPYKLSWVTAGLPALIRETCKMSGSQAEIKISWKLGDPHLSSVIRSTVKERAVDKHREGGRV
jgi:hypothetical protein